jgi:5-methylcytosine-specific restriction endonuclease McrA
MMRSLNKAWWEKNKERKRKANTNWYTTNKDKVKEIDNRRRARVANSEGTYTEEEFYTVCESLGFACQGCNIKFPLEDLTRDHIIPLFRGGSNYIENIQPLCLKCNSSKGTKTMEEWKA